MTNKKLTLEEKVKLVQERELGGESVTAICRRWRISRECAYKWWGRRQARGIDGLREASRAPRRQPRKLPAKWSERIAAVRKKHPRWGAKKRRVQLRREHPRVRLPAVSTIGAELRRSGQARGRAWRPAGPEVLWEPRLRARCANDVWTVDFKGWFRTGDGQRCEPLTVRDLASRYGRCAQVRERDADGACPEAIYEGLPASRPAAGDPLRPQAHPSLGADRRCSRGWSAWWVSLGIRVEFSRRARPGDNAAHEQWHREMKAETANPPAATARAPQRRQDRWLREYHEERPHEALGQRVPAHVYRPRPRRYEGIRVAASGAAFEPRRVRPGGEIRWQGRRRFVGESFEGHKVGLRKAEPGVWRVYFYQMLVGELHENDRRGLRSARYRRPPK